MKTKQNIMVEDFNVLRKLLDSLQQQLASSSYGEGPLHVVHMRRKRQKVFPGKYFGDPAWDIVVELYLAELSGTNFATSDVGLDAKIPMTTVLRYLALLEQDGIVERRADPRDRRRVFVKLSPYGVRGLQQILAPSQTVEELSVGLKLAA